MFPSTTSTTYPHPFIPTTVPHLRVTTLPIFLPDELSQLVVNACTMDSEEPTSRAKGVEEKEILVRGDDSQPVMKQAKITYMLNLSLVFIL